MASLPSDPSSSSRTVGRKTIYQDTWDASAFNFNKKPIANSAGNILKTLSWCGLLAISKNSEFLYGQTAVAKEKNTLLSTQGHSYPEGKYAVRIAFKSFQRIYVTWRPFSTGPISWNSLQFFLHQATSSAKKQLVGGVLRKFEPERCVGANGQGSKHNSPISSSKVNQYMAMSMN
jgi:hypothetical protein